MKDDFDIEEALKRFHHEPSESTRRAVLDEFRRTRRHGGPVRGAAGFMKRRVPLYAVAAALLICVGLSFRAGQWAGRQHGPSDAIQKPIMLNNAESPLEIQWALADNDLL